MVSRPTELLAGCVVCGEDNVVYCVLPLSVLRNSLQIAILHCVLGSCKVARAWLLLDTYFYYLDRPLDLTFGER